MQIGIDSFASTQTADGLADITQHPIVMAQLLERIEVADKAGIHFFGVGEHHRADFLDAAPSMILAAAAAKTQQIKLSSAVTVLATADPVRIFQQYATLDLISKGRAEIIAGRGSFSEAFPLFGVDFKDYDAIFEEKLALLVKLRDEPIINWQGQFRQALHNQAVYPRPVQDQLPIWRGIGGSIESCIRAGQLGVPLMIAIIGGNPLSFKRHIDTYRNTYRAAGHDPINCKVGLHLLGYLESNDQAAKDTFYPGYQEVFSKIGRERGWGPITRRYYDQITDFEGALMVGSPEMISKRLKYLDEALGGIDRVSFQMSVAALPHEKLLDATHLIGKSLISKLI